MQYIYLYIYIYIGEQVQMGHCLLKSQHCHYIHFPNFFGPAKWLGTKPRPCNKWVTPLHKHIINEYLEMTEAFSIETKPNYKPRDIFNPLTIRDESILRAALISPWSHRENEWVNLLCLELILEKLPAGTWWMICAITNKSSTLPQCSFCSSAGIVLQMT